MIKIRIQFKRFLLLILFCLLSTKAFTQQYTDTLTYHIERSKINSMLQARAEKFGQYDESLRQHTGIFGFQTKKDIRRSNDILMDIVKTDDDIYKEIKVLMEYRVFQQTQAQTHSQETDENNLGFMNTINKLRNELDNTKAINAEQEEHQQTTIRWVVLIFILLLGSILYLFIQNRKLKA
jgi:hypothetical protein